METYLRKIYQRIQALGRRSMRISVIIPTFRPSNYIWQCLASLESQTLAHDVFEVVIVLNGPKNPYLRILNDGLDRYGFTFHITLLYAEHPGVSNARNMALDVCIGEYVCFVDDDDWVSEYYLEVLSENAQVDAIPVTDVMDYDDETGQYQSGYIHKTYLKQCNKGGISLLSGRSFMSSCWCKMIPRIMIGANRFDVRYSLGEDALFMAALSRSVHTIKLTDRKAVYYRRINRNSATRRPISMLRKTQYAVRLVCSYCVLYLQDVRSANFLFFLSRVAATSLKIFKKEWI